MSLSLSYDTQLSRVRASITGLIDATTFALETSTDQVRWSTVRGASALAPTSGAASIDYYEFAPDVTNYFRVRGPAVCDDFARTVGAGSLGTATSGQTYTLVGTAGDFSVSTGAARVATTTINLLYYATADTGGTDQTVQVSSTCPVLPTGAAITLRAVARYTDANNYYEAILSIAAGGSTSLFLGKRVAGVGSTIGSGVTVGTHAAGNTWGIVLDVAGTALRARAWNTNTGSDPDAWQLSDTDSALTTGTRAGFGCRRETSNTNGTQTIVFDDFTATPIATIFTGNITPALDGVWLKSISRPFLNRQVTVSDWSEATRPARGGVFNVVGRSYPVAVSDVRGSRQWTIVLFTETLDEADVLDLVLASGDALLVHTPAAFPGRGGYVVVGDTTEAYPGPGNPERLFTLPVTEVAAPDATVVGATATCQSILNSFATCADVLAEFATCADLLDFVANPEDVIVS